MKRRERERERERGQHINHVRKLLLSVLTIFMHTTDHGLISVPCLSTKVYTQLV